MRVFCYTTEWLGRDRSHYNRNSKIIHYILELDPVEIFTAKLLNKTNIQVYNEIRAELKNLSMQTKIIKRVVIIRKNYCKAIKDKLRELRNERHKIVDGWDVFK